MSFIFLTLSIIFIVLQNGLYIENIAVPNVEIKKLYIKWNEKLEISVKDARITKKENTNNPRLDYKKINFFFKQLLLLNNWFEKISIYNVSYNDISVTFRYNEGKNGFLTAKSQNFSFASDLFFDAHLLNMKIDEFKDHARKIEVKGNVILDTDNIEISSILDININNDASLKLFLNANKEKLFYKINSLQNIKSITHTIELFKLPKEVRYWALDAIKMKDLSILHAYGWIEYKSLSQAYKTIYIEAIANELHYTYNTQLDSIHSEYTRLQYRDGILSILPKKAFSYNYFLDRSWLKIDFTQQQELLTLYLLFKGSLNSDMLGVLQRYKINLPFLQKQGLVSTNLKLEVNLRTIDVDAKGDFFTKKANFDYLGLNIDIYDAYVSLDNYDVTINNMLAKYKDIATSNVSVRYDAKNSRGEIKFNIEKFELKDVNLSLARQNTPLLVTYRIAPKKDMINIKKSKWMFNENQISVNQIKIPFDLDQLSAVIPPTLVEIPKIASAYVSGNTSIKEHKADIYLDLFDLSYKNVKLNQSNVPMRIKFDKKTEISFKNKFLFSVDDFNCSIDNGLAEIDDKYFRIIRADFDLDNTVKTDISGVYNIQEDLGQINLKNLYIQNDDVELLHLRESTLFDIRRHKDSTIINSKKLNINYQSNNKQWMFNLNSLQDISNYSILLRDYNLTNGNFSVYKNSDDKSIGFRADIFYPYKILVKDKKLIEHYQINGSIDKKNNIALNVNNAVDVHINKDIRIDAKDVGINLDALLEQIGKNKTEPDSTRDIYLKSKNSYLYISENRNIISDTMNFQYLKNKLSVQLTHKKGIAGFAYENKKFNLYGEGFGDEFMDKLFALSKFKGGSLTFSMEGNTSEYSGTFHVEDTIIVDYKVLNNILAFVNTVPSLVTFSLPGYSTNGLAAKSAYMNFHSKNDVFYISDIFLDSKEIDIFGKGTVSTKKDEIDLELNLKTDLGSSASKIPLVGYILFDGESLSTTLSITGTLNNPEVNSLIAKDIIVAPLNIIKRTLLLPYHLITGGKKDKEEDK